MAYYRDEAFLKKFGANLRKIRKEKGLSQEELANELEFTQPHIANIEAGKVERGKPKKNDPSDL